MTNERVGQQPGRGRLAFRVVLWFLVGGVALLVLSSLFLPDIDLPGEDRVAVVRVEGAILDSRQTVTELKQFGRNPSVKAIVLPIFRIIQST